MKILAIDTSTNYLTLAVMKDDKVIGRFHRKASMMHSSMLVPMIDKLLKKARLKIKDMDGFSIGIGPGSFTGLRIGVATVKGLAYSLNKPIMTVSSLDAIAQNAKRFKGIICPVLDARKNKVYACLYKSNGETVKRISKYLLLPADELMKELDSYDKILLMGDAVEQILRVTRGPARGAHKRSWGWGLTHPNYPDSQRARSTEGDRAAGPVKFVIENWYPRADIIGKLGIGLFKKRKFVKPENLEPMYLYSKECDITGR